MVPADRLLDQIPTLAHGNLALAGHSNPWTEEQRRDLGIRVTLLTAPDRAKAPDAPGSVG